MAQLRVTTGDAREILRASEGRPQGQDRGHTLERHVHIGKDNLRRRQETVTPSGEFRLLTAFADLQQCTEALRDTIDALSTLRVVDNWGNLPPGTRLNQERVFVKQPYRVRCGTGEGWITLQHFTIAGVKMADRWCNLHLITFYPVPV